MSIIDFELEEFRKLCENVVPNSKIIACTTDNPFVRVEICENKFNRNIVCCLRFPDLYPQQPVLVELKSRTLSDKFLQGLSKLCETKAREHLGKPQCVLVLKFLQQYLVENPLCVCFDEIQQLRRDLQSEETDGEQLKLKQKIQTVQFCARGGAYFYRLRAVIPDDYPQQCVDLQNAETNLPAVLLRYLNGQSREIARQCVQEPLRVTKGKKQTNTTFKPVPSLYRSLKFCLEATRDFYKELCPICSSGVLPPDPEKLVVDDTKDEYVERVYCGHLFHQGCLKRFLREPPFPKGGKLCPAKRRHPRSDANNYLGGGIGKQIADVREQCSSETCGIRLAHDRWVVNVKVAESRWAQKQARERELEEVVDFLK
ncbi:uncharacterized protein LOC119687391 [Teleopsis dalmanni]|uniref:uncharacterized protein LOC119687391 n=1 Tax=Teleopsis dalmanni TaxID=139649 RepID=UPI0018CCD112|nr:uncharacterized protein LOC119687391 [Teleopsis dalmanni]